MSTSMHSVEVEKQDHVRSYSDKASTEDQQDVPADASRQKQAEGIAEDDARQSVQLSSSSTPPPPPQPPNGGYGWVCTACAAFINGHTWGLNSSYGVFLAYYLANDVFPGASRLDYAFVGSLSIGCAMLISPLATSSVRLCGTKTTLTIGVLLETASLIGASFASKIWQLFLSQGLCFGFGMGFLFVASVGIVPQWFTTRRSLANGIAAAGSGIGGLLYSLAAGAMIQSIGLAWAFRILGILAFVVNTVCIILIKDRNKIIGSSQLAFDHKLFQRAEYLLLCGYGFFSLLGYVVLIFSLANYANAVGLSASQANIIQALFNLGQGLGRPPIGYFSDSTGRINMAGLMTFLCGLFALVIWVFAKSYGLLIFYALLGGTVAGTFWTTIGPVSAEVVGLRDVPSALNLIWLVIALPSTFSEPIALEIVAKTGGYIGAQLFTGFMYIAAAMCCLVLRGWKIRELEELNAVKDAGADAKAGGGDMPDMQARSRARKGMLMSCWRWRKV